MLASLDSPGRMVRVRRHVWNYAYWLTGAAGLALLGGLLSPCLSRAGEKPSCVRTSTRTQIITCCSRLTCSGLRCAGGLVVGIVLARLLAFLLLDGHFAAADEAVNAKLNRRAGAAASGPVK